MASLSTLVLALTLTLAPAAPADDFTIDWHTIDGGGGYSAGGDFGLEGTIGQPDALKYDLVSLYLLESSRSMNRPPDIY